MSNFQKRTRTRTGCLNCRRKKRKCDEHRPACGTCRRRDEACEWGLKISFRDENASSIDGSHPSMKVVARRRRPREFEILDVTAEVIRDYDMPSPPDIEEDCRSQDPRDSDIGLHHGHHESPATSSFALDGSSTLHAPSPDIFGQPEETLLPNETSPTSVRQTESAVANLMYLSQSGRAQLVVDHQLGSPLSHVPLDMAVNDYIDHYQAFTPEGPFEDGVFLPGSAYHELHSTLRNHIIQEVKSNAPTRPVTPENSHPDTVNNEADFTVGNVTDLAADMPMLNKDEEILLWRNWIDEIAPWLDKFDSDCHFQHVIPTMASSSDHLRSAVLALSARQIELKETTLPNDRSLALYHQAIHLLLPHLPTRSTEVIASCVILCVLEMLSCSPKAWRRHLDGCASLMEAVGINGFVGGVEEALFWCFARMDVCGGLISSVKTLIPISHWASKIDLEADAELFRTKSSFQSWANWAVYLVAQVLDLVTTSTVDTINRASPNFRARWLDLWKHVSSWHMLRPPALHSILTVPSSESPGPFPTILFSNPAAISGNQLYHTASILMLQNQPANVKIIPKPRSILWHARQVCGIAISNDHHGAWTNSVQPLWIAGKCMSHPEEHKAILDVLDRIERESGWKTKWRAEDLREFWGDLGD